MKAFDFDWKPIALIPALALLVLPFIGSGSTWVTLTVAGLAHLIDSGGGGRLRCCDRAGCGTAFLDTSRNGRRHFCSVRCANQVNVANHRLRRRQELPR